MTRPNSAIRFILVAALLTLAAAVAYQARAHYLLITLSILPLLIALPFLAMGQPRARAAAALLTIGYFIHGVTELVAAASKTAPAIEVAACTVLFVMAIVANVRERQSHQTTPPDPASSPE